MKLLLLVVLPIATAIQVGAFGVAWRRDARQRLRTHPMWLVVLGVVFLSVNVTAALLLGLHFHSDLGVPAGAIEGVLVLTAVFAVGYFANEFRRGIDGSTARWGDTPIIFRAWVIAAVALSSIVWFLVLVALEPVPE